jgi:hypothetical protein
VRNAAGGGVAAVPASVHGRRVGVVVAGVEARLPATGFFVLMEHSITEIRGRVEQEFQAPSWGTGLWLPGIQGLKVESIVQVDGP